MVEVEPWIKLTPGEVNGLKRIKGVVDNIMKNLEKLEKPIPYSEALNYVTEILTDMKTIQDNYFDPLFKRKLQIKELAKKIDDLNS